MEQRSVPGGAPAGLAVSLTFGGRPEVGDGFGIPLVIRYVLEVCGTVEEAVQVLRRVPVHMSYNVTALDRSGRWATVYVAPDRPPRVTDRAVTTNHQGSVEWAPYATAIRSVERERRLEELLAHGTGRIRHHRGLPAAAPLRQPLPPGLRDALYRRVPAGRRNRPLPLATVQLGAVAADRHRGPDPVGGNAERSVGDRRDHGLVSCCAQGSDPGRCASGDGGLKPAMSRVLLCRALEDNSPSVANLLHFERLNSPSGGAKGPERAHSASGPDRPAPGLTSCARPPCPPWRPLSSSVQ